MPDMETPVLRGAFRIQPEFPHHGVALDVYQRTNEDEWEDVNPDYSALHKMWTAMHFVEGGKPTQALEKYPEMLEILDFFKCDVDFMMFYRYNLMFG